MEIIERRWIKASTGRKTFWGFLLFLVLFLGVFGSDSGSGGVASAVAQTRTEEKPPMVFARPSKPSPADIEAGKAVYFRKCVFCHGPDGAGDGPESQTHWPRPRNFHAGTFKIRHTASGELPTEQDLFLTVTNGLPGSAMPSFERKLTEPERHQVIAFITTNFVKDRNFQDSDEEFHVIDYGNQIPSSEESIDKGKTIFMSKAKCFECHGVEGHGDGNLTMKDEWGNPIVPADLYKCWNFRGNRRDPYNPRNIFREVSTGLNGTPMPSFSEALTVEDRWNVANFVISLCPKQKIDPIKVLPATRFVVRARYVKSDIPADPGDQVWQKIDPQYIGLTQPVIETKRKFVQLMDNIWVKTIFNDQEIAWYLEWDDRTKSMAATGGAKRAGANEEVALYEDDPGFNDEIGILFWNDTKNLLDVWKWESDGVVKAYTAEGAIAQGVSLEERSGNNLKVVYTNFKNGQWRVIITRPLKAKKKYDVQFDTNKFIQTDFFAWDGHNGDHGVNFPKWEARYKTILVTDGSNPD